MKHLKDERGVALILELVLVGLVITLAGFGVYSASHRKVSATVAAKASPSPSKSPLSSPSPSTSPALHTTAEALSRVEQLYNGYIQDQEGSTLESTYGSYFSPQLEAKLFASPSPAPDTAGGGDPLLCGAQNRPSKLTYSSPTVSGSNASVVVYEYVYASSPSAHIDVNVSLSSLLVTALSCND